LLKIHVGRIDFVAHLPLNLAAMMPRPSTRNRKREATKEEGDSFSRLGGHSAHEPVQQERSRQGVGAQEPSAS
jgi:hypothetical protein